MCFGDRVVVGGLPHQQQYLNNCNNVNCTCNNNGNSNIININNILINGNKNNNNNDNININNVDYNKIKYDDDNNSFLLDDNFLFEVLNAELATVTPKQFLCRFDCDQQQEEEIKQRAQQQVQQQQFHQQLQQQLQQNELADVEQLLMQPATMHQSQQHVIHSYIPSTPLLLPSNNNNNNNNNNNDDAKYSPRVSVESHKSLETADADTTSPSSFTSVMKNVVLSSIKSNNINKKNNNNNNSKKITHITTVLKNVCKSNEHNHNVIADNHAIPVAQTQRLQRNLESARMSRQRKKAYLDNLEQELKCIKEDNARLQNGCIELQAENVFLNSQLEEIRLKLTNIFVTTH